MPTQERERIRGPGQVRAASRRDQRNGHGVYPCRRRRRTGEVHLLCYLRRHGLVVDESRENSIVIPIGAFAEPGFPAPTFSVYEERMHAWVGLPEDMEHMG
jgi:hypothetical protein